MRGGGEVPLYSAFRGQIDESVVEFGYNALNQLTRFVAADGRTTTYAYAPNGLRNRKTTQVEPGSLSVVTTNYYWDRGFIANETVNGVHSASNFIGVGGIFGRENFGPNGCNERFLMLKNWRGDVVSLVNDTGLLWRYDYSAFGVERPATGGCGTVWNSDGARVKPNNPFRFNGEYLCAASGLVYLRNRWYEPRTGRFTQEDPIRWGRNWYRFASNNPIMYGDPTGLIDAASQDQIAAQNTRPQSATMFTSASVLNVRATAAGTVMTQFQHGTQVTTTGFRRWADGRWWSQIQHGNGTAYVATEFLSATAPNAPAAKAQALALPPPPTDIMVALGVSWDDIATMSGMMTSSDQVFLGGIMDLGINGQDAIAVLFSYRREWPGSVFTDNTLIELGFNEGPVVMLGTWIRVNPHGLNPATVERIFAERQLDVVGGALTFDPNNWGSLVDIVDRILEMRDFDDE